MNPSPHTPGNAGKVPWGAFWRLVLIQAQNSFNEKGAQFLLIPLGVWLYGTQRGTWNTRWGPSSCCPSSCSPHSSAGFRTVSARRASSNSWRCSRSACWRACTGACVPITWTGPSCGSRLCRAGHHLQPVQEGHRQGHRGHLPHGVRQRHCGNGFHPQPAHRPDRRFRLVPLPAGAFHGYRLAPLAGGRLLPMV